MDLWRGDVETLVVQMGKMLLAFALCLPMAWDRERSDRSLGLRTFPLVAVASCAFVLVGQGDVRGDPGSLSRVIQGVVAGVGFLGGGAIVKHGVNVHGAATAAAVWATAALGVAAAEGELGIAVAIGILGYATLRWMRPFKEVANDIGGRGSDERPNVEDGTVTGAAEQALRAGAAKRSCGPRRRSRTVSAQR